MRKELSQYCRSPLIKSFAILLFLISSTGLLKADDLILECGWYTFKIQKPNSSDATRIYKLYDKVGFVELPVKKSNEDEFLFFAEEIYKMKDCNTSTFNNYRIDRNTGLLTREIYKVVGYPDPEKSPSAKKTYFEREYNKWLKEHKLPEKYAKDTAEKLVSAICTPDKGLASVKDLALTEQELAQLVSEEKYEEADKAFEETHKAECRLLKKKF